MKTGLIFIDMKQRHCFTSEYLRFCIYLGRLVLPTRLLGLEALMLVLS